MILYRPIILFVAMHGYYASKLMISKIVKHIEILHTFRLAMSYLAGRSNRAAANRRSH